MFIAAMEADPRIADIVFDPGGTQPYVKTREELPETWIQEEVRKTEDILQSAPLPGAAPPAMLSALAGVLRAAGVAEARGVLVTHTGMHQTWLIGVPTGDTRVMAEVWQNAQHELRRFVDSDDAIPDGALCDSRGDRLVADFGGPLI